MKTTEVGSMHKLVKAAGLTHKESMVIAEAVDGYIDGFMSSVALIKVASYLSGKKLRREEIDPDFIDWILDLCSDAMEKDIKDLGVPLRSAGS